MVSNDGIGALWTFREALIGLPLSLLWRVLGSAIFLEFGRWMTLRMEAVWKPTRKQWVRYAKNKWQYCRPLAALVTCLIVAHTATAQTPLGAVNKYLLPIPSPSVDTTPQRIVLGGVSGLSC